MVFPSGRSGWTNTTRSRAIERRPVRTCADLHGRWLGRWRGVRGGGRAAAGDVYRGLGRRDGRPRRRAPRPAKSRHRPPVSCAPSEAPRFAWVSPPQGPPHAGHTRLRLVRGKWDSSLVSVRRAFSRMRTPLPRVKPHTSTAALHRGGAVGIGREPTPRPPRSIEVLSRGELRHPWLTSRHALLPMR